MAKKERMTVGVKILPLAFAGILHGTAWPLWCSFPATPAAVDEREQPTYSWLSAGKIFIPLLN
jgi:hypothetical protein